MTWAALLRRVSDIVRPHKAKAHHVPGAGLNNQGGIAMGHLQEVVEEGVVHRFAKKSGMTLGDKVVKDVDHRLAVDFGHLCKGISHFSPRVDPWRPLGSPWGGR